MSGTVKRLVSDKGFGFILASDGNEYFFHNSAWVGIRFDDLREGTAVTFDKRHGAEGSARRDRQARLTVAAARRVLDPAHIPARATAINAEVARTSISTIRSCR